MVKHIYGIILLHFNTCRQAYLYEHTHASIQFHSVWVFSLQVRIYADTDSQKYAQTFMNYTSTHPHISWTQNINALITVNSSTHTMYTHTCIFIINTTPAHYQCPYHHCFITHTNVIKSHTSLTKKIYQQKLSTIFQLCPSWLCLLLSNFTVIILSCVIRLKWVKTYFRGKC